VRVVALESSRALANECFSHLPGKKERQMAAYRSLPDEKLFSWERVRITLPKSDLPGHPLTRINCDECGEGINDHREVERDGKFICRGCAGERYYEHIA
jgi:formylmethanofuran dehydrogenase subunit E